MTDLAPEALLVLPRLRVQNANTISSPLTWGFPAPSAFTGFAHALQRRLGSDTHLALEGVAVICHHFEAQVATPAGKRTKVFRLTRNPIEKNGSTAAIVEEGRVHLEVSLVIGVTGEPLYTGTPPEVLAARIYALATTMRLAGGSIFASPRTLSRREMPELVLWPGTHDEAQRLNRRIARRLLPGFALVSREALLEEHHRELCATNPDATALDALLDLSRLNIDPPAVDASGDTSSSTEWTVRRKPGWLVPIPAGYQAISPLYDVGTVKNARDRVTPFRFVESVFTIGQWLSPHRVDDVRRLMWVHRTELEPGVYCCTTPHFAHESLLEETDHGNE